MAGRGRAAYFDAAAAILTAEGADGVTIAAICERMHVTTGAFYYHFPTMPAFVAAYAHQWEGHWTAFIGDVAEMRDPVRRLEVLAGAVLGMPHAHEVAIRAWGNTHPVVKQAVRRLDDLSEALMVETLTQLVGDPERGVMLGHMAVALATGMLERGRPFDGERFATVAFEFFTACVGLDAETVRTDGRATGMRFRPREPRVSA